MFKSIFGRMFWTYAILLVIMFSLLSLFMTGLLRQFAERRQIETISSVAHTIEEWTTTLQIEQNDIRSVRAYNNLLHSWSRFTMTDITVINREGEVFESTCGIQSVPNEILKCIDTDKIFVIQSDFNGFYESKVLSISFPMQYKGNIIGAIVFNMAMPQIWETVFELLIMFLLSSLVSFLIAAIFVYIQAKKISAPIASINKAAQNIAKGDFSERVSITTKDEIGQLASTFNFMASSIEKAELNRQRFVSDVSHELRTPMTSITGFVQGMLDGTINDGERNDYLKIVLDESTRLTKLVNDMLEMSKMQSDKFKINVAPFDINDLICSSLISLESKMSAKGLDAQVDFRPENLVALGDKDQIKRVLINLLDNAIKFSHAKSVIRIKTYISKGKAHIAISNTGDKIPADELNHIFDRFYKSDKSRELDRTGAGLGLSLVQNIIRLHNQTISVTNEPDSNNSYTTTFEFTLEIK